MGKIKKDKHGQNLLDKQKHFPPFVLSVDEMMGEEAQVAITTLSWFMAKKMDEPISHVKGWVNGRIEIAVARSYSWVLHVSQAPSTLLTQEPDWALGLGLVLEQ